MKKKIFKGDPILCCPFRQRQQLKEWNSIGRNVSAFIWGGILFIWGRQHNYFSHPTLPPAPSQFIFPFFLLLKDIEAHRSWKINDEFQHLTLTCISCWLFKSFFLIHSSLGFLISVWAVKYRPDKVNKNVRLIQKKLLGFFGDVRDSSL